MSQITIVTFDGTGSLSPTNMEISPADNPDPTLTWKDRNMGGGYPANVASKLTTIAPHTWKWLPMNYRPGFSMPTDMPVKTGSIGRALNMLGSAMQSIPGKFVLCGLSQGAWICDLAFEEARHPQGFLHSRWNDLIAVVTFGSPRRPHGHTIDLPGVIDPVGAGATRFNHELSFGTVPGLVDDPPNWMWSFCQQGDAASDVPLSGIGADTIAAVAQMLWDGDWDSQWSVMGHILPLLVSLGLDPVERDNIVHILQQWWPFVSGALGNDPTVDNPHTHYHSYAYNALANNTKPATQLAVEYLLSRGAEYAGVPSPPDLPKLGYTWWQYPPGDAA